MHVYLIVQNTQTAFYIHRFGAHWRVLFNTVMQPQVGYQVMPGSYSTREGAEATCRLFFAKVTSVNN